MKKNILALFLAIIPVIFIANISSVKDWFISSALSDLYIRIFRDGKAVDANHVVAAMDNGMSIVVNKFDRCVCRFIRLTGHWDKNEKIIIDKIIKPGAKVVEIGANFGINTLQIAKIVGQNGKVVAIEANPHVAKYLKTSVAINNLENVVDVLTTAVSDQKFQSTLVYYEDNIGGGFVLDYDENRDFFCSQPNVHCMPTDVIKLDDAFGHENFDVLKLDAEGAEYKILDGADTFLLNNQNIVIMMEWSIPGMKRNKIAPELFAKKLQDMNMQIWKICKGGTLEHISIEQLIKLEYGDIVLTRDEKFLHL